jgi:2-polyprenyl-6-methoxyphenol hydroxylase-like FAD-dependent oxidoreductase
MNTVIIVGAGPVGLTAALSLAREGVPTIVLDRKLQWEQFGSRAIVLDRGSLDHFERLGCVRDMIAEGLIAKRRVTFFQTTPLFTNEFPQPSCCTELPRFLNLPQHRTESVLLKHVAAEPLITLLWGHEVTALTQNNAGVTLTVRVGSGEVETFDAPYVIACDGCRSPVRRLCNIPFPGVTSHSKFLIADVTVTLSFEREHRFFFDHPTNPGLTTLFVPQPNATWRLDWQLPAGADHHRELSGEILHQRVRATIGDDRPFQVEWKSCYHFHQRMMPRLSEGRVYFAGDAAHLVNPFGARGMNSGIHDVADLTWKMSQVMKGKAAACYLGTYERDRGTENRRNQKETTRTIRFVSPRTRLGMTLRNAVLRLSRHAKPIRRWVNSGRMSSPPPNSGRHVVPREFALKTPVLAP